MLTLSLLRHAKSSWDYAGLDDFERPLADRGHTAAPLMGRYIAANSLTPDTVLCSAAARTRATLDYVLPCLGGKAPKVVYEEALYLASASDILARLRNVPARYSKVLMIGHNPGFHDAALRLTATGPGEALSALKTKFPTAGLAVMTFDLPDWTKIAPRTGHLTQFVTPAQLQKGRASA